MHLPGVDGSLDGGPAHAREPFGEKDVEPPARRFKGNRE
jgi:hypothetical protein